jgi:DUF1009 family protein
MAQHPIAIVAGSGNLPLELAEAARRNGYDPVLFAIAGNFDVPPPTDMPVVEFDLGQVGLLKRKLSEHRITQMALAGHVLRPDLSAMSWDLGALKIMPSIAKAAIKGDDGAMKMVQGIMSDWGIEIIGPTMIAPDLVAAAGSMTQKTLPKAALAQAQLGFECLYRLDDIDVGQSAVALGERVVAIEAAEGTDAMLARVANLKAAGRLPANRSCGVLVKTAKPSQDLRLDMPVVGLETVKAAVAAGLNGIALGAGKVLIAERAEALAAADAAGIPIIGIEDQPNPPSTTVQTGQT